MAIVKKIKKISVSKIATLLIVVALAAQLLGFLRQRLIATNFTTVDPSASDAFFAAFQIPDFFFYVIAAGALGVAFIPILSDRLQANDRRGMWLITSSLLNLLTIAMVAVSVFTFIFAEQLIGVLAPKLDGEHFNQAVTIMRIIAFNPVFFMLSGVLTSVQQTMGRFFFYAVSPLIYNIAIIVSIYLFRDTVGIVGLGWGALAGAILQLLVAWLGMSGLGFRWYPRISFKNENFQGVMRALPPRSLDQGIDQVMSMVEVNRASMLGPGAISSYSFALTIQNVPILLIGNSIASAAFPKLTQRLSAHRPDLFRKDFLSILRVIIWLAAPTAVIIYFGRGYIARLLVGLASPEVALILGFLTVSIFFRIIYAMISRWFYAQKDTKTPLFVSIFAIALNIALAFSLARPTAEGGYDIAGLAMAQSIVAAAEVFVLTVIMLWRDRKLADPEFIGGLIKIASVTGFTLIAAYTMVSFLPFNLDDRGLVTLGSKFAAIAGVTALVHVLVSAAFGLSETKPIFAWIKKVVTARIKTSYTN